MIEQDAPRPDARFPDGFRWGVLGAQFEPYWPGFGVSLGVIAALLVSGALYFRRAEKTFADVI